MSKRLCIVIPMYNSEAFIERTLESIGASNLPPDFYDILVVNDGSTDKGAEIVERMAAGKQNIRLINQENGGSSKARNTGIDNADAEYIWFFDSDDTAESNLMVIPELLERIPGLDVYAFHYNWIRDGKFVGVGGSQPTVTHNRVMSGRDAVMQDYTPGSVCGLLLKRAFLLDSGLRFKEGITQQDVVFTYNLFATAGSVYFSTEKIYNYILRQDSISKAKDLKRRTKYLTDKIEVVRAYHQLAESKKATDAEMSSKIKTYADSALFSIVYHCYKNRKAWKANGINAQTLAKLKEYDYYPIRVPVSSWKKWLMSLVLNREFMLK